MAKKNNIKRVSGAEEIIEDRFKLNFEALFDRDVFERNIREILEENADAIDDEKAINNINLLKTPIESYALEKDKYDYTGERYLFRKASTKKYYTQAKKRFGSSYSEEKFADIWAIINSLILDGGYNYYDRVYTFFLASAIWILDYMTLNDKMDDLYECLSKLPDNYFETEDCHIDKGLIIMPFNHPMYTDDIVIAIVNVLIQRYDMQKDSQIKSERCIMMSLIRKNHLLIRYFVK